MGTYVVSQLVKFLTSRRIRVDGARVLVMGLAFKENCPDLRNGRVVHIVRELREYNVTVDVYDPLVSAEEAQAEFGISLLTDAEPGVYDGVILAVAHRQLFDMGAKAIRALCKAQHVLFDLNYVLPAQSADLRL